jgi:hypothetical protein
MALRHLGNQRGAGCAREFTQLALVARFAGQGVTILFRHGYVTISYGHITDTQCLYYP